MKHFPRTVLFLCAAFGAAASMPPASPDLDKAIQLIVTQEYDRAEHELKGLLKTNPDDFDALYLLLANRQTRILDYESYTIEDTDYYVYADSVLTVLNARLAQLHGDDSLRCLFYVGNVHGGKSIMLAKNEKWLAAISVALTSVNYLKHVIDMDPDFHAAYLGSGVFNYYLSKSLKWVPTFGNRQEKGLQDIRLATQAPFPYNLVAKNSLCWILIDRGEYARADSVASTVLAQLPYNTIFLRVRTMIAVYTQNWTAAERLSRRLIDASTRRSPTNWSDMTCGYHSLVDASYNLGKPREAAQCARDALALKIPQRARNIPYVSKHLNGIAQLVKQHPPES